MRSIETVQFFLQRLTITNENKNHVEIFKAHFGDFYESRDSFQNCVILLNRLSVAPAIFAYS